MFCCVRPRAQSERKRVKNVVDRLGGAIDRGIDDEDRELTDASNQCDPVFAKRINGIDQTLGSNRDGIVRSIDEARAWTERATSGNQPSSVAAIWCDCKVPD